jgi:hypothetical protein
MLPQGSKIERQEENPLGAQPQERKRHTLRLLVAHSLSKERGTRATKHNGAAFLP